LHLKQVIFRLVGQSLEMWPSSWSQFNQGSMLWSQFSAISPIFNEKIRVLDENQWYEHFFHKLAVFRVKNADFLLNFLAKVFKGHTVGPRFCQFFWSRENVNEIDGQTIWLD
jgi:hypothetical protein